MPPLFTGSLFARRIVLRVAVLLLIVHPSLVAYARAPKVHTVVLGPARHVAYTEPDATPDSKADETSSLRIRALYVDDRLKEWTTGEVHDITERTFAVRRALRINDALPTDKAPHWAWEPGPWLTVDRTSGHVAALHLPDFDSVVSNVVWYRDYAAYCGISTTARGSGLYAVVAQIGARRAIVLQKVGQWPQSNRFIPVCQPAVWQRLPVRVTLKPTGGEPTTYSVLGSSSIVEEGDNPDEN